MDAYYPHITIGVHEGDLFLSNDVVKHTDSCVYGMKFTEMNWQNLNLGPDNKGTDDQAATSVDNPTDAQVSPDSVENTQQEATRSVRVDDQAHPDKTFDGHNHPNASPSSAPIKVESKPSFMKSLFKKPSYRSSASGSSAKSDGQVDDKADPDSTFDEHYRPDPSPSSAPGIQVESKPSFMKSLFKKPSYRSSVSGSSTQSDGQVDDQAHPDKTFDEHYRPDPSPSSAPGIQVESKPSFNMKSLFKQPSYRSSVSGTSSQSDGHEESAKLPKADSMSKKLSKMFSGKSKKKIIETSEFDPFADEDLRATGPSAAADEEQVVQVSGPSAAWSDSSFHSALVEEDNDVTEDPPTPRAADVRHQIFSDGEVTGGSIRSQISSHPVNFDDDESVFSDISPEGQYSRQLSGRNRHRTAPSERIWFDPPVINSEAPSVPVPKSAGLSAPFPPIQYPSDPAFPPVQYPSAHVEEAEKPVPVHSTPATPMLKKEDLSIYSPFSQNLPRLRLPKSQREQPGA